MISNEHAGQTRLRAAILESIRPVTSISFASEKLLVKGRTTSSRGQVVEYFTCGEGTPIVFLTALGFGKSIWEYQILALHSQNRLVFPHLPGHLGSVFNGKRFTFQDIADDLSELFDHLKISSAHIVAWCMAGNIAQLFALRHAGKVRSLALVCTTPTDVRARGLTARDLATYSRDPLQTYCVEFQNIYPDSYKSPSVSRYLAMIHASHAPVDPGAMIYLMACLNRFNTLTRLRQINVPAMIIGGRWDIAFPLAQVELLRAIPGSRFVVFEDGGHLPFLNQAEKFNQELRSFISGTSHA